MGGLPDIAVYMIVGAVAGVIGGGLGQLAVRLKGPKMLAQILPVAAVAASIAVTTATLPAHRTDTVDGVMAQIKGMRMFAVILKDHPDEEAGLRASLAQAMATGSKDKAGVMAEAAGSTLVNKYLKTYLLAAPDEAVAALMKSQRQTLGQLKANPEACLDYFSGRPLPLDVLDSATVKRETDSKADLFEAADAHPTKPAAPDRAAIVATVQQAYAAKGFDINHYDALGGAGVDAGTRCGDAIEYLDALTALPAAKVSQVVKGQVQLAGG
jgi:hypothetical protein